MRIFLKNPTNDESIYDISEDGVIIHVKGLGLGLGLGLLLWILLGHTREMILHIGLK